MLICSLICTSFSEITSNFKDNIDNHDNVGDDNKHVDDDNGDDKEITAIIIATTLVMIIIIVIAIVAIKKYNNSFQIKNHPFLLHFKGYNSH